MNDRQNKVDFQAGPESTDVSLARGAILRSVVLIAKAS
jgi:hypothetical protein